MADDVMDKAAADAKPVSGERRRHERRDEPESRADRARRLAYRNRFAGFYVALAIVAGAGVGALLVLVGRGSPAPAPAWSAWEPTGSAERRVAQIGDHVGDQYRLPSGKPLVAVTYSGPPDRDAGRTARRSRCVRSQCDPTRPPDARSADDVNTVNAHEHRHVHALRPRELRARSPRGSPPRPRPAPPARGARARALLVPATSAGSTRRSCCFRRARTARPPRRSSSTKGDVRGELGQPLDQTLTAPLTPGVGEIAADEQRVVDRTTRSRLYEYSYLQAQDGSPRHGAHSGASS